MDRLQEDAELLDQMQVEKENLEKSHEEMIRQMEEVTDQEIEELKQMYCQMPFWCSVNDPFEILEHAYIGRNTHFFPAFCNAGMRVSWRRKQKQE